MKETESLLDAIEIEPKYKPTRSIIWLHGLGADGNDFVPIAKELKLSDDLAVRFIFPHAPIMPVTINGGYEMRAWYDILSTSLDARIDREGITHSIRQVQLLIEREVSRGIPSDNIILGGFSQGAAISLATGVSYPQRLGGIIALSGYLPLSNDVPSSSYHLPIFIGHGTFDPIVPLYLGKKSVEQLEAKGYQVSWHNYAMPHTVSLEEINDISTWLNSIWQSTSQR